MHPNIIGENAVWIHLRFDERLRQFFLDRRVSFGHRTAAQVSTIYLRKSAVIEPYCDFMQSNHVASIGSFSYSMSGFFEFSAGRYCSVAHGTATMSARHPIEHATTAGMPFRTGLPMQTKVWEEVLTPAHRPVLHTVPSIGEPPRLEHDVWIGQFAQIARDITLHTGCVVAAGAVVTKDVMPYMIVGGNPARVLRSRFDEVTIDRLLTSRWWDANPRLVVHQSLKDPMRFLDHLEATRTSEPDWAPETFTWRDVLATLG